MFDGFNDMTMKYLELISKHNNKEAFDSNRLLYDQGIKVPCEQLFCELSLFFSSIDPDLIICKRRCLSTPYNDARFCAQRPMKEYFYVRFKTGHSKPENTLGFFFDASQFCYRYGLNIYHLNSRGMEKIRHHMLNNRRKADLLIKEFRSIRSLQLVGQPYVKDHFAGENGAIKEWLNMKTISFHRIEEVNHLFFERVLVDILMDEYTKIIDLYFFIKDALK